MATQLDEAIKQDLTAEVSEWIEAFDEVVAHDWEQGAALLSALRTRAREAGVPAIGDTVTPYHNTIPTFDEVPYPGDRALEKPRRKPHPLERHGDGAQAEQVGPRHRRPHLHLLLAGHAARGRLQPLLPRHLPQRKRRPARRLHLLPGPCLPRRLLPRLSRRPLRRRPPRQLPPRARASPASPATPTPGSCRTSGSSPRSPWASARSTPSTRPAS